MSRRNAILGAVVCLVGVCMLVAVGRWEHHRDALTTVSLGLGMQRYTKGTATATLTNLSGSKLFYRGKVERKTEEGWPEYDRYGSVGIQARGTLLPGEAATLIVPVMNYAQAYPWRISIFCDRDPSLADQIRFRSQHPSSEVAFEAACPALMGGS